MELSVFNALNILITFINGWYEVIKVQQSVQRQPLRIVGNWKRMLLFIKVVI